MLKDDIREYHLSGMNDNKGQLIFSGLGCLVGIGLVAASLSLKPSMLSMVSLYIGAVMIPASVIGIVTGFKDRKKMKESYKDTSKMLDEIMR